MMTTIKLYMNNLTGWRKKQMTKLIVYSAVLASCGVLIYIYISDKLSQKDKIKIDLLKDRK